MTGDIAGALQATHLIVTGGRALRPAGVTRDDGGPKRPDRVKYDQAVVGVIDLKTRTARQVVAYEPDTTEWNWRSQNVIFKYGSLDSQGNLLAVTESEVIKFAIPSFEIVEKVSSPEFNDLHSVHEVDGSWLVTCTGRDLVLVVADGKVASRRLNTRSGQWEEVSAPSDVDWRELHTQPHDTHPNYVCFHEGELWITRGNRGDMVRAGGSEPVKLSENVVHDGSFQSGAWWATSVNGFVYEMDRNLRVRRTIHASAVVEPRDLRPGWCRGLLVSDSIIAVGFSSIRKTRIRRNLEWLATGGQYKDMAPPQVTFLDRESGAFVGSVRLDDCGFNSVFSVIPVNL